MKSTTIPSCTWHKSIRDQITPNGGKSTQVLLCSLQHKSVLDHIIPTKGTSNSSTVHITQSNLTPNYTHTIQNLQWYHYEPDITQSYTKLQPMKENL